MFVEIVFHYLFMFWIMILQEVRKSNEDNGIRISLSVGRKRIILQTRNFSFK